MQFYVMNPTKIVLTSFLAFAITAGKWSIAGRNFSCKSHMNMAAFCNGIFPKDKSSAMAIEAVIWKPQFFYF